MEEKKEVRSEIARRMTAHDRQALAMLSRKVSEALENDPYFREAGTAALFWPLADEPDIRPVIEKWSAKKRILLPVVDGDNLLFRQYTPGCPMKNGCFGIPGPETDRIFTASEMDLIVVPGVAFDTAGHRLGRGKGYYDRFLAGTIVRKTGICFPFQMLDNIPHQPHDIRMDHVIR